MVWKNMREALDKKQYPYPVKVLPSNEPQTQLAHLERLCHDAFEKCNWHNYGLLFVFKKSEDASWFILHL
jgi:hypothetical protein